MYFVPYILAAEQNEDGIAIFLDLIREAGNNPV